MIGTLGRSVHLPGAGLSDTSPLSSAASDRTTPESSDLFRMLRRAVDVGARSAAVEVSSHALDQGRLNGMGFDAAVFTNLSRDHLDYHPSMEAYYGAKRRLFSLLRSGGHAVVNVDDEYGRRLAAEIGSKARVWRCSSAGRTDAEVRVVRSKLDLAGIRAEIETPGGDLSLASRLLGRFNLENLTAAVAAACAPWECRPTRFGPRLPRNSPWTAGSSRWIAGRSFRCSSTTPTPTAVCAPRSGRSANSATGASWSSSAAAATGIAASGS